MANEVNPPYCIKMWMTTDTSKMKILTLIVGGALLGVVSADQSELSIPEDQPLGEGNEGMRRVETPEVVLQLKYDEGELKRIYLAQFRKPGKSWSPSVSDRSNLCADLCHAGFGGTVCGSYCSQLIPVGLHTALEDGNSTEASGEVTPYGQPRVAVCPVLCDNSMGKPLCQCQKQEEQKETVDWPAICEAFCLDGYTLGGCPTCEAPTASPSQLMMMTQRALGTMEGWSAWCDVQCRQGHGGAACNCDRTPFQ